MVMIRSGFLVMTDVDDDRKCTLRNENMNRVISIPKQHKKHDFSREAALPTVSELNTNYQFRLLLSQVVGSV